MKQLFLFAAALCFFLTATAQQTDSTQPQKIQVKLSVNYNSNLNYYGRTDSLKSSAVFPMAELWFTPQLYVNAAPIFVNNSGQRMAYAGSVATLGYLHTSKHAVVNSYLLKPFYTQSSRLVQSALKLQAGASVTALSKVLNITLGGDAKWSDRMDYGAMAGLDHVVRIAAKNNRVWVFDPSVYLYAGTQNFSRSYQKKTGGLFPRQQQVTETVTAFNILSYEASLPIIYNSGHWQLLVTPAYVVPKNLLQAPNRPQQPERGAALFYSTVGLKYSF